MSYPYSGYGAGGAYGGGGGWHHYGGGGSSTNPMHAQQHAQGEPRSDCVLLSISHVRGQSMQALTQQLHSLPNKTEELQQPFHGGQPMGSVGIMVECWTNERTIYCDEQDPQTKAAFVHQLPIDALFCIVYEIQPRAFHTVVGRKYSDLTYHFWDYQRNIDVSAEVFTKPLVMAFWWGPGSHLIQDDEDDF
jgi:hypothetical protein